MEEKSRKRKLSVTDDPDDPGVESINERTKIRKVEQLGKWVDERLFTAFVTNFHLNLQPKVG